MQVDANGCVVTWFLVERRSSKHVATGGFLLSWLLRLCVRKKKSVKDTLRKAAHVLRSVLMHFFPLEASGAKSRGLGRALVGHHPQVPTMCVEPFLWTEN